MLNPPNDRPTQHQTPPNDRPTMPNPGGRETPITPASLGARVGRWAPWTPNGAMVATQAHAIAGKEGTLPKQILALEETRKPQSAPRSSISPPAVAPAKRASRAGTPAARWGRRGQCMGIRVNVPVLSFPLWSMLLSP